MYIVEIYENWLYSIQFDEEDLNEYARVFKEWHDLDYLEKFFTDNAAYIDTPFWKDAGLAPMILKHPHRRCLTKRKNWKDTLRNLFPT
ncbi:hypothetical protein [Phocaeicola sartorii]|uniref:hypothetical protein n=1 Tax=Phocaeicola sartorii TaxID=671267 RepID=UPI002590E76F|nr:hypothetical protein [Phocaeicola sartorii]